MRVLLIKPPYTRLKGVGQSPYFPLGLGYIASVLNDNGFEVMIYHAENPRSKNEVMLTEADIGFEFRSASHKKYLKNIKDNNYYVWKEVYDTISSYKPDIVGITMLSVEVASALKISQLCKQYNEKCYVVWGGVHPTFLFDDCLKYKEVDFVIRGEGEYSMLELCRALEEGGLGFQKVKGLSFKSNGLIKHNPNRAPIADIDEIPFAARESVLYPESFDFKSLGSMIISRGCPFRCTFCSSRNFWDKKIRFRSPENVIKEIKLLKKLYGANHIMFWDDTLTFNRGIVEKYCNAIIDAKLKINWKSSTRANLIDEELLKLMKNAGCVKLEIGVESGSDRLKRLIFKDVKNDEIKRAFSLINSAGIGSGAFFMAGFPEENINDIKQTFQLMRDLDATELAFNIFDPMPGSVEYEKCLKLGLVSKNPDWADFPFWPDAHYVSNISKEDFSNYANMIAKWLYKRNNSLRFKFKRNKFHIKFLIFNDPSYLLKKIYGYIIRRIQVQRLKKKSLTAFKETKNEDNVSGSYTS